MARGNPSREPQIVQVRGYFRLDVYERSVQLPMGSLSLEAQRELLVALLNSYFADGMTRLRKLWVDGGDHATWLCAGVWGLNRTPKID